MLWSTHKRFKGFVLVYIMSLIVSFIVIFTSPRSVLAAQSDTFNFNKIHSLAVFIGTFDPIHRDHELTIDWISRQPNINAVLVLPHNLVLHKPSSTRYHHRYNMLNLLYADHPKIIIPSFLEGVSMGSATFLKRLKSKFPHLYLTGYVGEDVASTFFKRTILKFLWPMDRWEIVARDENSSFGKKIPNKSGVSSSNIRNYLNQNRDLLNPIVFEYISREGIYSLNNCDALFN